MKKINDNSPIPLYFQIQEDLRTKINNQYYKNNEKIPTESQLEQEYGVSRITVRKAIEGLVYEGILVKRQGIGTIVSNRKINEDSLVLRSFTEKMTNQGFSIRTQVLEANHITISDRIAEHLQSHAKDKALYIKRVRYIDDEPIAIFSSYIPASIGIELDNDFGGSLFSIFEDKYNIKIHYSDRVISASLASKEEASLLSIRPNEAVLLVKYTTYDTSGRLVEYAEGVYRSDKYQYSLRYFRE